jgi:hypothetical protein
MATQNGFLSFIRDAMAIDQTNLPDGDSVIPLAYQLAIDTVAPEIAQVSPTSYDQAVYNLSGDILINLASDVGEPPAGQLGFFGTLRKKWGIGNFTPGVVQSTSDVSTSAGLLVQNAANTFTLDNLQNLKTPYGRSYLYIAQKFGPLWGLT